MSAGPSERRAARPSRCWGVRAPVVLAMVAVAVLVAGPGPAGARPAPDAPAAKSFGPPRAGLAATPPMGWNNWNAYRCDVSESLIKQTADVMVKSGMRRAGYKYINIDDCWMTGQRDSGGNLVADPGKFPGGMKALASYVHGKGLRLGIYSSAGTTTCAGFPASLGHEVQDAKLWAGWGIDYVKYDNCGEHGGRTPQDRYQAMSDALKGSGRKIVFSLCNWGGDQVWTWGKSVGQLWRTTGDSRPEWNNFLPRYEANVELASYAGPGGWNDPDMLETGNGQTAVEERSEFSLWAQMAAPLISGSDLTKAGRSTMSVLTNKEVIAVDQDSLGKQGTRVSSSGGLDVLAKPLAGGDVSVVLFNKTDTTAKISTTTDAVGATGSSTYTLRNLWTGTKTSTTGMISSNVTAHGVVMYRVSSGS
jgi:alpha-galactosidase